MGDIKKILTERGNQYGDFKDQALIVQRLKKEIIPKIYHNVNEYHYSGAVILEGMEMILHKISRIANGNPFYIDSWRDIAGYAQLVVDMLEDFQKPIKKENGNEGDGNEGEENEDIDEYY